MKFRFIKSEDTQEIVAYNIEKTNLIKEIERLCYQDSNLIIGYDNKIIKELNPIEIECFYTQNEKIYARTNNQDYLIKKRLYELNEMLKDSFIYINQGCLVNIKKIDHFDASISGTLLIYLKSGFKDYVSRRQIKNIKERLGL